MVADQGHLAPQGSGSEEAKVPGVRHDPSGEPLADRVGHGAAKERGVRLEHRRGEPQKSAGTGVSRRRGRIAREGAGELHDGHDLRRLREVRKLLRAASREDHRAGPLLRPAPRNPQRRKDLHPQPFPGEVELPVELPGRLEEESPHVPPRTRAAVDLDPDARQGKVAPVRLRELAFPIGGHRPGRAAGRPRDAVHEHLLLVPVRRLDGHRPRRDGNQEAGAVRRRRLHLLPGAPRDLRAAGAPDPEQQVARRDGKRHLDPDPALLAPQVDRREAPPRPFLPELRAQPVPGGDPRGARDEGPAVLDARHRSDPIPDVPRFASRRHLARARPPGQSRVSSPVR